MKKRFKAYIDEQLKKIESLSGAEALRKQVLERMIIRAQELYKKGMSDYELIYRTVTFELDEMLKNCKGDEALSQLKKYANKSNVEKTLKAEMWDRMQFLLRNFYDRMTHMKLNYDGKFDIEALKNIVVFMFEHAPVLHSSFKPSAIKPYWKVSDYKVDEIVKVVRCDNPDKAADKFLTSVIPYDNNVQMKITVFEQDDKSVLTMVSNHMCMDGGDLKYFWATLCANYNRLKKKNYADIVMKSGSRGYEQVYSKFSGEDLKKARSLYKNVSKNKDKVYFPWTKPSDLDKNRIVTREIDEERFNKMRAVAKALGVTVNDALMVLVVRALYEICGHEGNAPLTVSCAIDLRRHILEGGANGGLTNHTAWLACRTDKKGESVRDTIAEVVKAMQKHKTDKFMGLYSLPLLNLAYTIFPQNLAEFAIKLGYDNPLLAVSNAGKVGDDLIVFEGTKLTGGFMTGTTKYKPYFLMTATTLLGTMTLSTSMRGSDADVEIVNRYFDIIEKNLAEFNAIEL